VQGRIGSVSFPADNRLPLRDEAATTRRCRTVKINSKNQFGTTGVADPGAAARVYEGPPAVGHLIKTPVGDPGPAGDEQLR
jgi:hypothetical protein